MNGEELLKKLQELPVEELRQKKVKFSYWESNGEGSDFEVETDAETVSIHDNEIIISAW